VIPAKSARKVSRDATSSAFRRERARAREKSERLTERRFPTFSSPSKGKTSKTTGNAGARLACGIVGKVKTIAHVLFFSFLFFSSKRPSRIIETRRDSPKNLDSRSSRRERKSDSSETSLHARYLLCKTHRSRNTARNKLYKHTVRNRRGVLSPFVSCETTSHDSKTSPRSGPKRET